jgi:hypothetical protein
MFQMMGVFAEFERAMIQERVRAGLRRAVSEGKQLGRPRYRSRDGRAHQEGASGPWPAGRAGDCQAVWRGAEHRDANQPPFRKRRLKR